MAIDVEKSNMVVNQIVANKYEVATIESDCIVPDVKPDIIKVISTSGTLSVYKKEVSDGKIRIDGSVDSYVMYAGSDGNSKQIRSINHSLDFSQIISIPEATAEMTDMGSVELLSMSCKMINERKISIKANLGFLIKLGKSSNIEYVSNIKVADLQKLNSKVTVNSILGMGETKTSVNEKMMIDNSEQLAEILRVNTKIMNVDTKVSYNKILLKADVNLKVLYSTEDGKYNSKSSTYPIMGFIDMKDVAETNTIIPNVQIKNFILKPNGSQDHSISVDIEVGMSAIVYENKDVDIVKDLYSPSRNLIFNQKSVTIIQNSAITTSVLNFNQKAGIDIGDSKVVDVNVEILQNSIKADGDFANFDGTIKFGFIYVNDGLQMKNLELPISYKIPIKGVNADSKIDVRYEISNDNFNILPGGEVDIRMDIKFVAMTSNLIEISLIDSVDEDLKANTPNYNMVIYYTKTGDKLWNIAKQFRSTGDDILKINGLKSESEIVPGSQLFITRA